jgi:hypothetical protein
VQKPLRMGVSKGKERKESDGETKQNKAQLTESD